MPLTEDRLQTLKATIVTCLLASGLLPSGAPPARAQASTDQIRFDYAIPTDPSLLKTYNDVRERRVLERLKEFLSPFRLPKPVTFTFRGCDGEDDAYYFDYHITLCYELIDELRWASPKQTTEGGVSPHDAVAGPFFNTAVHEFAHAFFELHRTPIFGQEEAAADQFAAYIILLQDEETASRLIRGTAYAFLTEAKEDRSASSIEYTSEHGLAEQRYYNVLCMAYGAYPDFFSDLGSLEIIPADRAELCQDEFEQIEDAYKALILTHVDEDVAKKAWRALVVRQE